MSFKLVWLGGLVYNRPIYMSKGYDLKMKPWLEPDQDLVARVRQMVVEAMAAARNLEMVLELTRQTLHWADRLVEAMEEVNPLPRPVACEVGCSSCCHNQVEVTPSEVILIAQIIQRYFAPGKQAEIRERILRAAALRVGRGKAEIAASRLQSPCPLLAKDKCMVYPWRPLSCRAMHSLSREHCRASLEAEDLSGEEYYLHRHVFPLSLSAGLLEGFRDAGCQAVVLDLVPALAQALLEPLLAERWLRGEKVFTA